MEVKDFQQVTRDKSFCILFQAFTLFPKGFWFQDHLYWNHWNLLDMQFLGHTLDLLNQNSEIGLGTLSL